MLLSRRTGDYDDDALTKEGNGLRVWYDDYTTIDWIHDYVKERVRVRTLRSQQGFRGFFMNNFDALQAWILILLIGVFCGSLASFVNYSEMLLSDLKEGYCTTNPLSTKSLCCRNNSTQTTCVFWRPWSDPLTKDPIQTSWIEYVIYVTAGILYALVAGWVTYQSAIHPRSGDIGVFSRQNEKVLYPAAGGGIPELKTILGGFVIRGFLGLRTLFTKAMALIFVMASGLCIGQQGPLVHISACVGNVVSRLFPKYAKNEAKRREMLSAASAAGVSVAFGAPIGGVLFSLEEVSYYFPSKTMWRSFVCALTAAVTVKLINPFGTGKLVSFQVTYHHDWHTFEMIPFAFLGVLGDVAVDLVDFVITTNYDHVIHLLITCLAIKGLLTISTFGLRIPSGVFSPSMAIGACAGRVLAVVIQSTIKSHPDWFPFVRCDVGKDCIIPGVYAMVGAAAAVSGVTRMTVSLVITMVELTGALTYVLPIMTSIMVAKWTADIFSKDSIYDALIRKSGHPYLDHKREHHHKDGALGRPPATAGDVAVVGDARLLFDVDGTYGEVDLCEILKGEGLSDSGFPVLKKDVLVGYLGFTELDHAWRPTLSYNEFIHGTRH
ncbi:hypothetical protein HDU67_000475 [Dinochytrium kinnereticum]|nr:hypothetical protein HDU67_000475 [Dinochytrium kinnereticum]